MVISISLLSLKLDSFCTSQTDCLCINVLKILSKDLLFSWIYGNTHIFSEHSSIQTLSFKKGQTIKWPMHLHLEKLVSLLEVISYSTSILHSWENKSLPWENNLVNFLYWSLLWNGTLSDWRLWPVCFNITASQIQHYFLIPEVPLCISFKSSIYELWKLPTGRGLPLTDRCLHVTVGSGLPIARHSRVTLLPSFTVMSEEIFMIWGGTVKRQRRKAVRENDSQHSKGGVSLYYIRIAGFYDDYYSQ